MVLKGRLPVTLLMQELLSVPIQSITFTTAPAPGKIEHNP